MARNRFIIPAIIFGLGAIFSSLIIAAGFRNIKVGAETMNVTGSARELIISDLGLLRITLSAEGATAAEAYRNLQASKPVLLQYLATKGFPEDKLNYQPMNNYPNYLFGPNGQQSSVRSYTASQMIDFKSSDVNKIRDVSLDIGSLVERGVSLSVNPPEYYYTKLPDIKVRIQAAAARDAMLRGQRVAEATGRKLGTLKSARMGVLQITPENSNQTSDYGINDVSSIRKEITAVVNASFEIE
ncbi:MAG TPA: SIMPL domain-containing protein [Sphingobacteriaceae bacterium]